MVHLKSKMGKSRLGILANSHSSTLGFFYFQTKKRETRDYKFENKEEANRSARGHVIST